MSRLEQLLRAERELRESKEKANDSQKEERKLEKAKERQRLIDEAVKAAQATSQAALDAMKKLEVSPVKRDMKKDDKKKKDD